MFHDDVVFERTLISNLSHLQISISILKIQCNKIFVLLTFLIFINVCIQMPETNPVVGEGAKSKELKCILHKSEIPIHLRRPGLPYSVLEAARTKLTGER